MKLQEMREKTVEELKNAVVEKDVENAWRKAFT